MPLKENTTKNGIDLNEIDVSQLALVDKKNLLGDLSTKLKIGIEEAFSESLSKLGESVQAPQQNSTSFHQAPTPTAPNTPAPVPEPKEAPISLDDIEYKDPPPAPPKAPKQRPSGYQPIYNSQGGLSEQEIKKQQEEFEKLRKLKNQVDKQMVMATGRQRKSNRDQREKEQKGTVYTPKGLGHARSIDNIIDEIHKANGKELEKLKDQVSMLRKNIELDTKGSEQALLTEHAEQLQKELLAESEQRKTMFGKIQHAFNENAINVTSIVAGLTAHSPMMGLATKYLLEKIKSTRKLRKNRKTKRFVSPKNWWTRFPGSRSPEDNTDKLDDENLRPILQNADADNRHELLQAAHKQNRITDEQHQRLVAEFTPPHYMPAEQRIERDRLMRQGQPVPTHLQPQQTPVAAQPQPVVDAQHSTAPASPSQVKLKYGSTARSRWNHAIRPRGCVCSVWSAQNQSRLRRSRKKESTQTGKR